MNRWLAVLIAALPACATVTWAGEADSRLAAVFEKEVRPLLSTHCFRCHGAEKQKGDINLETYKTGDAALKALKIWHKASGQVTSKEMPPEKEKTQPTDAERAVIAKWVKSVFDAQPADPGRVTVRRLNRNEYNNTVRDLFGFDIKPANEFPEDDVGNGFDNIGDVLSLPPLLMEKYLIAADQLLEKAIIIEQANFKVEADKWTVMQDGKEVAKTAAPAEDPKAPKPPPGVQMVTASEVRGFINFPVDGRYTFKVKVGADQAGNEPANLGIKLDDKLTKEGKVTSSKNSPGTITVQADVKRGIRAVSFAFLNPFEEPPIEAPAPGAKPAVGAIPGRPAPKPGKPKVRSINVVSADIVGPPTPAMPDAHKRIFVAKPDPKAPDSKQARRDAAKQIVSRFATRAYRRPVSDAQLERLLKLFDVSQTNGEVFEESVRFALKGVLVSPSFLFRAEPDRATKEANGAYALDGWEIASRLSYFIWSSMPDDALFEQAKTGKLSDRLVIAAEVQRMLKDPKSRALVENFGGQWLQLKKIDYIEPDLKVFPEFTPEMRKALYDETAMYFESIVREDRSVLEFIDSDYAFLNDRLAKHYGISGVSGSQLRKVQLTDRNRGGLLGQGSILAITSMPTRTSPVKRGKWVLEQLLGDPPPPPPPMVEALEKEKDGAEVKNLSLRDKMERHRTDPVCNSCHKVMDAIGFGLENFDAMGRWREKDGTGKELDTAGKMPSGASFKSPSELKGVFMAAKSKFVACMTEKMLTYALGRGVETYDEPAIEKIGKALEANGYRFSVLVSEIAISYPFTHRRNH